MRRTEKPSLLPWLEAMESLKLEILPAALKLLRNGAGWISFGGEGEDSSGPRILAPPSDVIDRRTLERTRLSDFAAGGEDSLGAGLGTDDGIVRSLESIGRTAEEKIDDAKTATDDGKAEEEGSNVAGNVCAGVAGIEQGCAGATL